MQTRLDYLNQHINHEHYNQALFPSTKSFKTDYFEKRNNMTSIIFLRRIAAGLSRPSSPRITPSSIITTKLSQPNPLYRPFSSTTPSSSSSSTSLFINYLEKLQPTLNHITASELYSTLKPDPITAEMPNDVHVLDVR